MENRKITERLQQLEEMTKQLNEQFQKIKDNEIPIVASNNTANIIPIVASNNTANIIQHIPIVTNNNIEAITPITNASCSSNNEHSIFLKLSRSQKSKISEYENKLLQKYISYIESFIETHIIELDEEIKMDYRLIPLTLEFISAAKTEICQLSSIKEFDIEIAIECCIWLLNYYKEISKTKALHLPHNLNLLIKSYYDVKSEKYVFDRVKYLEWNEPKIRKSILSKSKQRFATIKNRFNKRTPEEAGCLPNL
jgi:hypothetical protein